MTAIPRCLGGGLGGWGGGGSFGPLFQTPFRPPVTGTPEGLRGRVGGGSGGTPPHMIQNGV